MARSTSGPSGLLRVWTSRIASRPATSGGETRIWRSKRPGRSSAGSSFSSRFDAAITTRSPPESNPSISTSSWLSVCSRSELLSLPRVAADGVELVDEDDRRAVLARLGEQPPDAGGAEAGEHLDERGGRLGEELRAGLVRDRLGQQRLAGAGRAVQQDPLRHVGAERREPLGVAQELDDLGELRLGLVAAGDVIPRRSRCRLGLDLLRLGPRHQLQRPPDEEHQQAHEDDRRPGDDPVLDLVPRDPASMLGMAPSMPAARPSAPGVWTLFSECPTRPRRAGSRRARRGRPRAGARRARACRPGAGSRSPGA